MRFIVKYILLFYIFLLPWLAMINLFFEYGRVFNIFRELTVLILIIPVILNLKNVKGRSNIPFFFGIFLLVYLVCYLLMVPSAASFFGFRLYAWPIIVFMAIVSFDFNKKDLAKYLKLFFLSTVLVCVFSVFQQLVLGESFLLSGDYPRDPENPEKLTFVYYIAFGLFQRGTGGFVTPIPFSIFCALALIIISRAKYFDVQIINYQKVAVFVIWVALILTFTRSTIVFTVFALLLYNFKFRNLKKLFWLLVFLILLVSLGLTLLDEDLAIVTTFYSFAENLYNLNDSSAVGHFDSLIEGMEWAINNIYYGYGLGQIGPHAEAYGSVNIVIESMLLSIVVENGLFFFLLYCAFMFGILVSSNFDPVVIKLYAMYFAVALFLPIGYYLDLNIIFSMLLAFMVKLVTEKPQTEVSIQTSQLV